MDTIEIKVNDGNNVKVYTENFYTLTWEVVVDFISILEKTSVLNKIMKVEGKREASSNEILSAFSIFLLDYYDEALSILFRTFSDLKPDEFDYIEMDTMLSALINLGSASTSIIKPMLKSEGDNDVSSSSEDIDATRGFKITMLDVEMILSQSLNCSVFDIKKEKAFRVIDLIESFTNSNRKGNRSKASGVVAGVDLSEFDKDNIRVRDDGAVVVRRDATKMSGSILTMGGSTNG